MNGIQLKAPKKSFKRSAQSLENVTEILGNFGNFCFKKEFLLHLKGGNLDLRQLKSNISSMKIILQTL